MITKLVLKYKKAIGGAIVVALSWVALKVGLDVSDEALATIQTFLVGAVVAWLRNQNL